MFIEILWIEKVRKYYGVLLIGEVLRSGKDLDSYKE